jgi:alkylated DNA nucleotide flippase Atl1
VGEEFVEAVLEAVEQVPAGRVTTYGAIAATIDGGGPRQVGRVMSTHGDLVSWWRVVHADGTPATCHDGTALRHLIDESTPMRSEHRVDLARANWPLEEPRSE